jgi:hypothetical protein
LRAAAIPAAPWVRRHFRVGHRVSVRNRLSNRRYSQGLSSRFSRTLNLGRRHSLNRLNRLNSPLRSLKTAARFG